MYKYKKVKRISSNLIEDGNNRYIVSLDNHVEIMAGLTAFCNDLGIKCGQVSGIGACELLVGSFRDTAVGRKYDPETGLNLYEL